MSTSTESSSLDATSRTVGLSSPGPAVISQSPGQSDFLADKLAGSSLRSVSCALPPEGDGLRSPPYSTAPSCLGNESSPAADIDLTLHFPSGTSLGDESSLLDRRRGSTEGASSAPPIFAAGRARPGSAADVSSSGSPLAPPFLAPPLPQSSSLFLADSTDDEGEMSLRRYSLDMEEYHRAILSGIPPPADGVLPSKKKTAAGKAKAAVDSAK